MQTPAAKTENKASKSSQPNGKFFGKGQDMPFFQAKLTVNTPGDAYEQEADRVADQVMGMPDPVQRGDKTEKNGAAPVEIQRKVAPVSPAPVEVKQPAATPALSRVQPSLVQAKCAECSQKEKEQKEEERQEGKMPVMRATKMHDINGTGMVPVQRACAACAKEEEVRRKETPAAIDGGAPVHIRRAVAEEQQEEEMPAMRKESNSDPGGKAAPSVVSDVLSSGGGHPMDGGTRQFMESRFGQDFGQVRIHTDAQAAESASAINARAYTSGNNVVFGSGEYRPETDSGRRLLAHELVHVGQQGEGIYRDTLINAIKIPKCGEEDKKKEDAKPPEEEKTGQNYTPGQGLCVITKQPVEQPPEGTPEPTDGDATSIGVEEKAPVEERQKNAPPPGAGVPQGDPNLAENIKEGAKIKEILCPDNPLPEVPDQAKKIKPRRKKAIPKPKKTSREPVTDDPSAADWPKNEQADTDKQDDKVLQDKDGKEKGQKGGEKDKTADQAGAIAGQGDNVPEKPLTPTEQIKAKLLTSAQRVSRLTDSPVRFNTAFGAKFPRDEEKEKQDRENLNQSQFIATRLLGRAAMLSDGLANQGDFAASDLHALTSQCTDSINSAVEQQIALTTSRFNALRKDAKSKIRSGIRQVEAKHKETLDNMSKKWMDSRKDIEKSYNDNIKALQKAASDSYKNIESNYRTGYLSIIATGGKYSKQAVSRASKHAVRYEYALDGTPHQRYLVQNEESDGFWDGKLTYKRFMARKDAAINVGEQFKEGFQSQAIEIAFKLMCGKGKDVETVGEMTRQGFEAMLCLRDKALASLDVQYQANVQLANDFKEESVQGLKDALTSANIELNDQEQKQIQAIRDLGQAQITSLQRQSESIQLAILKGTDNAVTAIGDHIAGFRSAMLETEIPEPDDFAPEIAAESRRLNAACTDTRSMQDKAYQKGLLSLQTQTLQNTEAIALLQESSSAEAETKLVTVLDEIKIQVSEIRKTFTKIGKNNDTQLAAGKDAGIKTLEAVNTGVNSLFTKISSGITTTFANTVTDVSKGFQKSLNDDLDKKVCKYAEEAASKVKPRWKKILKVLLIVLVVVVVLVVAPALLAAVGSAAAALAGSAGASLALAGTIGAWVGPIVGGAILGALSGAAIQVGSNAIDGVKLTEGLKGAIISGAIGGALGGLGGRLAAIWVGRAATAATAVGGRASGVAQFARQYGTEAAFDLAGSVLGDLAAGNPITFESIATGMVMAGTIQSGVKIGGKVGGALKTRTTVGGKVVSKIEGFQKRSFEFGENLGARAGFGKNAPSPDMAKAAVREATGRIEGGEFFPVKEAPAAKTTPTESAAPVKPAESPDAPKKSGETVTPAKPAETPKAPESATPVKPDETPGAPKETPEAATPAKPAETPKAPESATPVKPDETPGAPKETPEAATPAKPAETPKAPESATPVKPDETPGAPKETESGTPAKTADETPGASKEGAEVPKADVSEGNLPTSTPSGHKVSEGPDGSIIRCSPRCAKLKKRFEYELNKKGNEKLKARLKEIEKMPSGKKKMDAAKKLEEDLYNVRETGEVSHKRWDDKSLTRKEFVDDYNAEFPGTKLSDAEIRAYYDAGYRLNPATGKFKNPKTGADAPIDVPARSRALDTIETTGKKTPEAKQLQSLENERSKLIKKRNKHPKGSDKYNEIDKQVRDTSEELGEHASDLYMMEKHGLQPVYTGSGSRTLDKVYEGKNGEFFVSEAKGGSSPLGTKIGTEGAMKGKIMEQGSRPYLEQTIKEMEAMNPILAGKLKKALAQGKIKYLHVKQRIDSDGVLKPIEVSEFII